MVYLSYCHFLFEIQLLCVRLHIQVLSFVDSVWSRVLLPLIKGLSSFSIRTLLTVLNYRTQNEVLNGEI